MYGKHPTQKPVRILKRMIKLASRENDIILTPFSGSGSECVAAKMTGRNFIGIELDNSYCEIARIRLAHIEENEDQLGQLSLNLYQGGIAK